MTHNLLKEPVFRPAVDALKRVWIALKNKEVIDVSSMNGDEINAYYELIDFCEAIVESEVPSDIDIDI